MIQPIEMRKQFPMTLHGSAMSTTTEVWEMLRASRDGDLDRVRQLLSQRPELSSCQYNYTSPLHFAVREGHLHLVRELVERKAFDPGYKTYPFGDSLLTMAQDRGYDEIAALLQETLGRPELTRKLVETGGIVFGQDDEQKRFDSAVHAGNLHEVESLLAKRAELAHNEISSWAEGVLMMPAKKRNRAMLELLMRFGATVPDISKWGRFYYFVHDDIAGFLLESGMNPKHMTWHEVTLLHDMAQSGDIAKAALLLDYGADINAIDEEYRSTPLGLAARWGKKEMVRFLLGRGADPDKAGATWSTPLVWAKEKGHSSVAAELKSAGKRPD